MPGLRVVAVCAPCGEIRYRTTREFQRTEKPTPSDFEPVGDSPIPSLGEKATCFACLGALTFRMVPPDDPIFGKTANRRPDKLHNLSTNGHSSPDDIVNTLFSAEPGEEVRQIRDLPNDRMLVVTSKRIVLVNLESLLIQEVSRGPV